MIICTCTFTCKIVLYVQCYELTWSGIITYRMQWRTSPLIINYMCLMNVFNWNRTMTINYAIVSVVGISCIPVRFIIIITTYHPCNPYSWWITIMGWLLTLFSISWENNLFVRMRLKYVYKVITVHNVNENVWNRQVKYII